MAKDLVNICIIKDVTKLFKLAILQESVRGNHSYFNK